MQSAQTAGSAKRTLRRGGGAHWHFIDREALPPQQMASKGIKVEYNAAALELLPLKCLRAVFSRSYFEPQSSFLSHLPSNYRSSALNHLHRAADNSLRLPLTPVPQAQPNYAGHPSQTAPCSFPPFAARYEEPS